MIQFFRKIRLALLSQSKFSQYLLYAIGEIVLVVIGILLALQINNWNEKRKRSDSIVTLFEVLKGELEQNIASSNTSIQIGLELDRGLKGIFQNNISVEEMRDFAALIELGTFTQNFLDDNLSKIIENEKEIPKEYINLIPHIKELKRRIASQRRWEKTILDMVYEHRIHYAEKLDWLHKRDSVSINKSIQFMLTDEIFKNKLKNWSRTMLNENMWDMSLIRTSSAYILWKTNTIQNASFNASFEQLLEQNEMTPMQVFDCKDALTVQNSTYDFRINTTIYNNTNESVTLNLVDASGNHILNISVPPMNLLMDELALGANDNYLFIEVQKEGNCSAIHGFEPNGFLVIN